MRLFLAIIACACIASCECRCDDVDFFERRIRPVLVEKCYHCHAAGAKSVKGELLLDSRDGGRRGGESGPAIVPGDPGKSLLLSALRYDSFEMPPSGKLSDAVIADFETWIRSGAADPRDAVVNHPASAESGIDIAAGRKFWAFQKPTPHVAPASLSGQPIDGFIEQQLRENSLTLNSPADRATLVRRLWLTVVGLPPDAAAVADFVADEQSGAWSHAVDDALASPHYGERWARMWLDVARYAEDQAHIVGENSALFYPNAYLYRDWVITNLNSDIPYDRFVMLQLAADKIEPGNDSNHAALGFIGLGPKYYQRNNAGVMADEWENQVDTVTRGLLGLTVACARCHDHKYDPIPTTDYYALAGVFAGTELFNRPLDDGRTKGKNGHSKEPKDAIHIVRDTKKPENISVHIRGNVANKGDVVPRGFPVVLTAEPVHFSTGSGRLELAKSIADRSNPLTARVIVNRVWGELFGQALVETRSNFGELGDRPTHPQLLDDLAVRFMDNGWSLKWLCREILLSATWQQSSEVDADAVEADPENKLLSHMNRQRLSVEIWRDTVLSVSGQLEDVVGGESMDPLVLSGKRRTVYSRISRLDLNPLLATFDFPDPNVHAGNRVRTTTPLQKLFLMNSPFMVAHAKQLATGCLAAASSNELRVRFAMDLVFGREASNEELELALSFLGDETSKQHQQRWQQFAQTLLASNELQFVD